jgi:hypothetical protein
MERERLKRNLVHQSILSRGLPTAVAAFLGLLKDSQHCCSQPIRVQRIDPELASKGVRCLERKPSTRHQPAHGEQKKAQKKEKRGGEGGGEKEGERDGGYEEEKSKQGERLKQKQRGGRHAPRVTTHMNGLACSFPRASVGCSSVNLCVIWRAAGMSTPPLLTSRF